MSKGFGFTIDGLVGVFLVLTAAGLIFNIPIMNTQAAELQAQAKANDLLQAWLAKDTLSLVDMERDFRWVFPNQSGDISIGTTSIHITNNLNSNTEQAIRVSALRFQDDLFIPIQVMVTLPIE